MKLSQKQNKPSPYSLHLHSKQGERCTLNKKYILSNYPPTVTNKKYFSNHKYTNTHTTFNYNGKVDHDRTLLTEGFPGKTETVMKNSTSEKDADKYIPYKNDEYMRKIFESCIEYRIKKRQKNSHPSLESSTLLLKIDKSKENSTSNILSFQKTLNKTNEFTINVKELRLKNKKNRNDTVNCGVVNLFSSIEHQIKPIHKYVSSPNGFLSCMTSSKHIQLATGLERELIDSAKDQRMIMKDQHMQYKGLIPIRSQQTANLEVQKSFERVMKENKSLEGSRKLSIDCGKKEFEVKPWSTHQIIVDI